MLSLKLWPDNTWDNLRTELQVLLESEKDIVYIALVGDTYVGFIQLSIRNDYVEGSHSSPVGYIEGIYVDENYRNRGISKELVRLGEQWTKSLGCSEIASDTELDNYGSQEFHKKLGFAEAGRIVTFVKKID
ncbi:aminoglycoside 6'-N-acetyltransferase [Caldalkalibacillus mannanilyticus]|uniref:aminoglycoside 6'-N-acetyltransferase n=1 Tax=Caldalkalibacillus mannanilyticus TaxID=1418 RepID=UPI0019003833|nr:aminoglycoside 6'-N-acetyltransferase [Caldalkalibacillus mannanilyticus]